MEKHNNEQQNELLNNEQNVQQNAAQKENKKKEESLAKGMLKNVAKAGAGAATKAIVPILIKIGLGMALAGMLGVIGVKVVQALKGNDKIDKTMTIVEEVKKIGEFVCACYYEELVVTRTKTVAEVADTLSEESQKDKNVNLALKLLAPVPYMLHKHHKNAESQIVLLTRGKIRAGFDLQKLTEKDLKYANDTLFLALPQVETFDIIMNPSDITVMYESGKWSHEEITGFITTARDSMVVNAKNYGYEEKARDNGIEKLKAMFASFGFPNVVIDIKQ